MLSGSAMSTTSKFTIHYNTNKMTFETAESLQAAEQTEQLNVLGDIFANMMHDAEVALAAQRAAMESQITASTIAIGTMIKDAMLNICASAGMDGNALRGVIAHKKNLLDTVGHTDDTEGGSQD
jgi:hypothetical protein